jgi:outer membrane protein assembly factor BamB
MRRILLVCLLLLPGAGALGGGAAPAGGQAVPNAGLDRNPVNLTDRNPPLYWNVEDGKRRNVKWVQEIGTRGYNSPVVAGGRVFVSTNNGQPRDPAVKGHRAIVMCFAERDGKYLWQAAHDMAPPQVDQQGRDDGMCSVPAVTHDRLFYVTPGCVVVCADVATGQALWTYDLMKELKVYPCVCNNCSPLVVGDTVYVVTGNGIDDNDRVAFPDAPSFVALDRRTGRLRWKSALPGDKIIHGQWGSPAYAEVDGKGQVIFPGGDGVLYSFEPATGELLWKFRCTPLRGTPQEQRKPNYLIATPVVRGSRVYTALGHAPEMGYGNVVGRLFCVDITKRGDVSPVNDNFDPQAAVNKDSALVWHYGGVVENPDKGERKVRFGSMLSRCAVHGDLVYAVEESGYLHCLDAASGKKYWEHDFRNAVWSSPYWVGDRVYVFQENGEGIVFAHGREKRVLAELDMDDVVQSTPVVANGVLFVATKMKLYAIAAR